MHAEGKDILDFYRNPATQSLFTTLDPCSSAHLLDSVMYDCLMHAEGKDILDFYRDPATRSLFKLHIWGLISRTNPLTGLAPRDDSNVVGWSILNEPRCPGEG
jgi:hypothetical protein